jgi:hypothetical protein
MDSSLHEVWQAAASSPFVPTVGKDNQFFVGFALLILGLGLGGAFTLSMFGVSSFPTSPNASLFLHVLTISIQTGQL